MERPIIFSPPMASAILAGTKTVTRRIVKFPVRKMSSADHESPTYTMAQGTATEMTSDSNASSIELSDTGRETTLDLCPYGQPGDRLSLKESFYAFGRWETRFNEKHQHSEWHFIDLTLQSGLAYQFSEPTDYVKTSRSNPEPAWWRRPSLFMPRRASRINLEITDVHIERLRDITDEQARAEGFSPMHDGMHSYFVNHMSPPNSGMSVTAVIAFAVYWQSLNGVESWDANPWVWVVGFRPVTS